MGRIMMVEGKVLNNLIKKNMVMIVDVRNLWELQKGRIPGAIHIPLHELSSNNIELPHDRNKMVAFYCKSGIRSRLACERLFRQGVKRNLWNYRGGMTDWVAQDFSIEPQIR